MRILASNARCGYSSAGRKNDNFNVHLPIILHSPKISLFLLQILHHHPPSEPSHCHPLHLIIKSGLHHFAVVSECHKCQNSHSHLPTQPHTVQFKLSVSSRGASHHRQFISDQLQTEDPNGIFQTLRHILVTQSRFLKLTIPVLVKIIVIRQFAFKLSWFKIRIFY